MFARLVKTISMYFGVNLVAKIINFFFFAWVSRWLTIDEMGEFSLLNMSVTLLSLLMLMEIPSGFYRYYLEQPQAERDIFENSVINFLLVFDTVLVGVFIVIYILCPNIFAMLPNDTLAMFFILLIPFGNAIVNIYQVKMRLLQQAGNVARVILTQSISYIVSFYLLWYLGMSKLASLMGAFVGQNLFIVLFCYKDFRTWRPIICWQKIQECARFSFWLVPSSIGAYFSLLSGKYFLGSKNMIRDIGIYEGNNKVANTFQLVMEPIYMAVSPMYFARYREDGYRFFYLHTLIGIVLLMLMVIIITGCFSREIIWIVLGGKYVAYYSYLYFFIGLSIFQFMSRILATNIHLAKKSQYDTAIEIFSGIINCALCFGVLNFFDGGLKEVVMVITLCYGMRMWLYLMVANHCFLKTAIPLLYGIVFLVAGTGISLGNYMLQGLEFYWRLAICLLEIVSVAFIIAKFVRIEIKSIWK